MRSTDRAADGTLDGGHRRDVERVRHRDDQSAVVLLHRHGRVRARDSLGDRIRNRGVQLQLRRRDERHTRIITQRSDQIILAQVAEGDECLSEIFACDCLGRERLIDLLLRDETGVDETLAQAFPHRHSVSFATRYRTPKVW
jgi:hypothetical protein